LNFRRTKTPAAPSQRNTTWHLRWAMPTLLVTAFGVTIWWLSDREHSPLSTKESLQAVSEPMRWKLEFDPAYAPGLISAKDPETMVRQIYQSLGEGERAQALVTARNLTLQFPNFQLGQLLYADLLNISSHHPMEGAELEANAQPSTLRRLEELVLEAKRRLTRTAPEALQGQIPASVAFMAAQQPYLAAVDASRSRLYWFANRTGADGRLKLELLKETYVSVGINGVGKIKEGDGKTPVGVYFIQKNLPGATLPDLFGVGALTLNYPNAIDAMRNKTGSGIWLHGTPSAQYSRAPEATDGCVVLSNPEMEQFLSLPGWRMTPVIIAEKLDWIDAGQVSSVYDTFKPSLDRWIADRQATDAEKLKTHYSQRFERDALDLEHWWPKLAQAISMQRNVKPLEVISVLHWNDGEETMVVTMSDPSVKDKRQPVFLRTYWQKEAGQWKLVFEGPT
jgi:L,D-transpeptidase catalytic domain